MALEEEVKSSFPSLNQIEDNELRNKVVEAWTKGIEDSKYSTIREVPWLKTMLDDYKLVKHIEEVTTAVIQFIDQYEQKGNKIDRNELIAASILHDISDLAEDSIEEIDQLIPHPHYSVYMLERFALPYHTQHIVLSHSPKSNVEPQTFEADVLQTIDYLIAQGSFWSEKNELIL